MTRMRITAGTLILGAGALAFGTWAPGAAASPDPRPAAGASSADLAAARGAAARAVPTLGRFFASHGRPAPGAAISSASAAAMRPALTGATVPVYELASGFVTGGSTRVAQLAFVATEAVSADGQKASVWAARDARGAWNVVNIASGNDETAYTAKAGPGAIAFHEPQLNAWYALRGGQVVPLNGPAAAIGKSLPVAGYQRLVHQRYADKMPGSAYDKRGTAGGFGAQAPAPEVNKKTDGSGSGLPLILAAGTVTLFGGTALQRRRAAR